MMKKLLFLNLLLIFIYGCTSVASSAPPAAGDNSIAQRPEGFSITYGESEQNEGNNQLSGQAAMRYDPVTQTYLLDFTVNGTSYHNSYETYANFTPRVSTAIAFDPASGIYTYTYTVSNLAGPQAIRAFDFYDEVEISNTQQPENWHNFDGPSAVYPYGGWSANERIGGQIQPGDSKIFSFQTIAPPGIVEGRLFGRQILTGSLEYTAYPSQLNHKLLELANSPGFAYIQFHLPGPVPVPDPSGQAQAERFAALLKQAEELKWITPETAQTLSAEFEPVKAALLGRGESSKASQTMLEQLETLKNQDKLNNKSYQLFKGNLLFFTRKNKGANQTIPRYPSEAESCQARMKFLGCQVEAYYLNHDRFPHGLSQLGFPARCPIDGSAYSFQCRAFPWGYTVTCPACHDGGRAGEVQYSSSQKPAPTVDLANPGNDN